MDPVFYKIYKIWVFYQYGYTDITTFSDPCKEDGSTSITWEPWRSCGERSWASIQCRWSREWCNSRDGCQVKENISRTGWDVLTGSKRRRRLEPWPKVFSSTKSRHWRGEVSRYMAELRRHIIEQSLQGVSKKKVILYNTAGAMVLLTVRANWILSKSNRWLRRRCNISRKTQTSQAWTLTQCDVWPCP